MGCLSTIRKQMLPRILAGFTEQGSTGWYHSIRGDYLGPVQLLGGPDPDSRSVALAALGLSHQDVAELARAHSDGLWAAGADRLVGLEHSGCFDHRAIIGTPAFDRVWSYIERWAA